VSYSSISICVRPHNFYDHIILWVCRRRPSVNTIVSVQQL